MNPIEQEIKKFLYALQFLTIIRLKYITQWDEKFAARAVVYFPLVGILTGCILAVAYFILSFIFPNSVGLTAITAITAIILLIIETLLTRGMHLDGFIDTIDGIFGGMNKEERLRIMKDPHPGSFGIVAVMLLILLKFALLFEILNFAQFLIALILILFPALGRYAMLIPMSVYPYARTDGTGKMGGFTKFVSAREILTASLFIILSVLLIVVAFLNLNFFNSKTVMFAMMLITVITVLIIALLIFSLLLSKYITSKIGGMTGDTYGFINEISEVFVLLAFVLCRFD